MKIALCFWGLTRSLKHTIGSIEEYIFKPLDEAGIKYDKYLHTYHFKGMYNNSLGGEKDIKLDFTEYTLLKPDFISIENQDIVKENINFEKYYSPGEKKTYYKIYCHNNAVLGLNSMKKVTEMVESTGIKYDFIWFIRPDCKYLKPCNPRWFILTKDKRYGNKFVKMLIPRFGCPHNGLNDRMVAGPYKHAITFGKSLDILPEYVKDKLYIAEEFTKYVIDKYCGNDGDPGVVRKIDFNFQRIRATGKIAKQDLKLDIYSKKK